MKSPVKGSAVLLALLVVSCTASYAAPKRPWSVGVTTTGGFSGRGTGDYAINSEGKVTARLLSGGACAFDATADDVRRIEALLAKARPSQWKASYLPENPCCDRIEYTLTYDEAEKVTTTKWIDDPEKMPADLVALGDAIVGGADTSIRMMATKKCAN